MLTLDEVRSIRSEAPDPIKKEMAALILRKKLLAKQKRQLQAKGYDVFVETGDDKLLAQAEDISRVIAFINTQIHFLVNNNKEENSIKLHGNKYEQNSAKAAARDFSYSTGRRKF